MQASPLTKSQYLSIVFAEEHQFCEGADFIIIEAIELEDSDETPRTDELFVEVYNRGIMLYSKLLKNFNNETESNRTLYVPGNTTYSVKIVNRRVEDSFILHYSINYVPTKDYPELIKSHVTDKYYLNTDNRPFINDVCLRQGNNFITKHDSNVFKFHSIVGNVKSIEIKVRCGYKYIFSKELLQFLLRDNNTFKVEIVSDCFEVFVDCDKDERVHMSYTSIRNPNNCFFKIHQFPLAVNYENLAYSNKFKNNTFIVISPIKLEAIKAFVAKFKVLDITNVGVDFWTKKIYNYMCINNLHYYEINIDILEEFKSNIFEMSLNFYPATNVKVYEVLNNALIYDSSNSSIRYSRG